MRGGLARLLLGLALSTAMASCERGGAQTSDPKGMMTVKADDAEVNAATTEARRTLPRFRRLFESRPADVENYWVKVAMPTSSGGEELLWIDHLGWAGGAVEGQIENEPVYLKGLHIGSKVRLGEGAIADWSYSKGGKLYGHFTTRVLMRRASAAEAKDVLGLLSAEPIESGLP